MTYLDTIALDRHQIRLLPDGHRLHLQDGPIDLIIEAFGADAQVAAAYRAARHRFIGLLDELCAELPELRRPVTTDAQPPSGPVARRMFAAVRPFCTHGFITPMAAVAGSVADEILAAMTDAAGDRLARAYVNNGGDIALHLASGTQFVAGLVDRPDRPSLFAKAMIRAGDGVGGIATSGAGGRSFSLGIADAVTVLARTSAEADAAATVLANAVDLPGHPGIVRVAAAKLQPDSDLRDLAVTRSVPLLSEPEIYMALTRGAVLAETFRNDGRLAAAALHLQGRTRLAGPIPVGHDVCAA
jgi:ApbE superfamily uncharacterized protein (UPF0280 family)